MGGLFYGWILENKLWLLLAVGSAFNFWWLMKNSKKLQIKYSSAFVLSVLHTILGVICVKIFAIVEVGFDMEKAGAMSLFGGVFFMPILYFIGAKLTKHKVSDVFDVFTICMIFTLMCARYNCILSGCCHGKTIMEGNTLQWPTRELEIIFYIILLYYLMKKMKKKDMRGTAYPIYMTAYGVFRFITEWLREGTPVFVGGFHISHLWALVSIGIGLLSLYLLKSKNVTKKKMIKKY